MKHPKPWQTSTAEEAAAGQAFANVILALGTGTLGLTTTNPPISQGTLLIFLSAIILLAGFYSSIFYASTFGSIRQAASDKRSALNSIILGNAISEYFGVYIFNYTIPLAVWSYTEDPTSTRLTVGVVLIAFMLYHVSRFDMLMRIAPNRLARLAIGIIISITVIVMIESLIWGHPIISNLACGSLLLLSIALSVLHLIKSE